MQIKKNLIPKAFRIKEFFKYLEVISDSQQKKKNVYIHLDSCCCCCFSPKEILRM